MCYKIVRLICKFTVDDREDENSSAFRWGIMQNSPIDAATSAFDLLGGYPAGRIRPDGEAGDTSFPAGSGRIGSIRLIGHTH